MKKDNRTLEEIAVDLSKAVQKGHKKYPNSIVYVYDDNNHFKTTNEYRDDALLYFKSGTNTGKEFTPEEALQLIIRCCS